jgi:tetratricopeptide (TPR) repeat protein
MIALLIGYNLALGQSFMARGTASFKEADYKQAANWYKWAIKADSSNSEAFFNRGNAFRMLKNYEKAFSDFKVAIKLDSSDGNAHFLFGLSAFYLGNMNASLEGNSEAIKYGSNYGSQAWLNRAETYIRLGENKKAIKDFSAVVELKGHNLMNAHFYRGQLHMRMNDKISALSDYKKVIDINPKNVQLTWDIGRVSYEIEEYADALTYYSRALEQIDEPQAQLFLIRGEVFEKLKHYAGAIEDYTRVIEMNPNSANAYYGRGQAKARSGDNAAACVDWKVASKLGHQEAKGVIVYNCK